MTDLPEDLKYAPTHEWARLDDDGTIKVGITDFAQEQLGDLVFIQLPEAGKKLAFKDQCATLESVKTASDIYSPIAGEVIALNEDVVDEPQLVNEAPYKNWLFSLRPESGASLDGLMSAEQYRKSIDE